MKKVGIYLAGPMDNVSLEEMSSWRKQVINYFKEDERFVIYDPCRRPHSSNLNEREIMLLDLKDIDNSDLLLVDNRDLGKPTFGTPCEVFYAAYIQNKPTIAWSDIITCRRGVFQKALFTREFTSLIASLEHISEYYG